MTAPDGWTVVHHGTNGNTITVTQTVGQPVRWDWAMVSDDGAGEGTGRIDRINSRHPEALIVADDGRWHVIDLYDLHDDNPEG